MKFRKINPWISQFIQDRNLVVLRDARSDKALNVSYSETGLKLTTTSLGLLPYFKKARIHSLHGIIGEDLSPSEAVYVEKFIPRNHDSAALQKAEIQACARAKHLLYGWVGQGFRKSNRKGGSAKLALRQQGVPIDKHSDKPSLVKN